MDCRSKFGCIMWTTNWQNNGIKNDIPGPYQTFPCTVLFVCIPAMIIDQNDDVKIALKCAMQVTKFFTLWQYANPIHKTACSWLLIYRCLKLIVTKLWTLGIVYCESEKQHDPYDWNTAHLQNEKWRLFMVRILVVALLSMTWHIHMRCNCCCPVWRFFQGYIDIPKNSEIFRNRNQKINILTHHGWLESASRPRTDIRTTFIGHSVYIVPLLAV